MVDKINLSVDTDQLQRFCNKLIKRSRDIAKTHESLVMLESFIILFGKAAHGTSEYQAVEELIKNYTEQTRQQLLSLRQQELHIALSDCDLNAITAIYTPLSREGFHTILKQVVAQFSNKKVQTITQWARHWTAQAKLEAEQASGYPDATDFKKAGINHETYQAMSDISRYLLNSQD